MGLGVGILLLAVGAILTFAIHVNPTNGAILVAKNLDDKVPGRPRTLLAPHHGCRADRGNQHEHDRSEVAGVTLARLLLRIDGRDDLLDQFDHSRGAA